MNFISWNVNGLRAILKKNFMKIFKNLNADFFCLQEIKMQKGQVTLNLPNYYQFFNYAEKKGYSGTAIFTKYKPINIFYGINNPLFDNEGRVITLEYSNFFLMTCYTPNSGEKLKRLNFRQKWDCEFLKYTLNLTKNKPLIYCGDLNVAHENIDLKNYSSNHHNAGFTDEERNDFTKQLNSGFVDTFRYLYPNKKDIYSYWSYRFGARKRNAGWRIDYFITSKSLVNKIKDSKILTNVLGSDHCPVELITENLIN